MTKRSELAAIILSVVFAIGLTLSHRSSNSPEPIRHHSKNTQRAQTQYPEPPRIVRLGWFLQQKGFLVSEHPAFGGVCQSCHIPGSAHYKGRAIDVNAVYHEEELLTQLAIQLKLRGWTVYWQVPGHYDHLHVER